MATVDENGVITAVAAGTTTLYASVDIYDAVREYTVTVSNDGYILGDADSDGDVTIIDTTVIQRHLVSLPTPAMDRDAADVDGDGSVTIIDATLIQRYDVKLETPFAIGRKKLRFIPEY